MCSTYCTGASVVLVLAFWGLRVGRGRRVPAGAGLPPSTVDSLCSFFFFPPARHPAHSAGLRDPRGARPLAASVCDNHSVATAVAAILAATGDRVDVAVANAGYAARTTVEGVPVGDYAAMMDVNFFGALRLVKAVVPSMRRRRAGRVLGVSSVSDLVGSPFFGAYAASKFAIEGCWESAHAEFKSLGVHLYWCVWGGEGASVCGLRGRTRRSLCPCTLT